jgi:hypothetical protein
MSSSPFKYTSGLGHVAAYQVSGKPFALSGIAVPGNASEPIEIAFPAVTRSITVRNDNASDAIRVGFSAYGTMGAENNYYFTLAGGASWQEDIKVSSVFLLSNETGAGVATVIAGLTGIPRGTIANNFSGSVGVG